MIKSGPDVEQMITQDNGDLVIGRLSDVQYETPVSRPARRVRTHRSVVVTFLVALDKMPEIEQVMLCPFDLQSPRWLARHPRRRLFQSAVGEHGRRVLINVSDDV